MGTNPTTPQVHTRAVTANSSRRAAFWGRDTGTVRAEIDLGVDNTVKNIRVVQTVVLGTQLSGVMAGPDDQPNLEKMSVAEGLTTPCSELSVEFSLSNGHIHMEGVP